MIVIFRMGCHIVVPYLDPNALKEMIGQGTIFGFVDILSGGAFANATIFAMSIGPTLQLRSLYSC